MVDYWEHADDNCDHDVGQISESTVNGLCPLCLLSKLDSHRQFMADVSDDMECAPECDSYGHRNNCPVTNPMEAWRQLHSRLDSALKNIENYKAAEAWARTDYEKLQSRLERVRDALKKHQWDKSTYWLEQTLKPILNEDSPVEGRVSEPGS